jgi:hypothetical protein
MPKGNKITSEEVIKETEKLVSLLENMDDNKAGLAEFICHEIAFTGSDGCIFHALGILSEAKFHIRGTFIQYSVEEDDKNLNEN